jgi:hypothetical protein
MLSVSQRDRRRGWSSSAYSDESLTSLIETGQKGLGQLGDMWKQIVVGSPTMVWANPKIGRRKTVQSPVNPDDGLKAFPRIAILGKAWRSFGRGLEILTQNR